MFTRKQYLAGECTHDQYYLAIADAAGLKAGDPGRIKACRAALMAGDEHLNTLPLPNWGKLLPSSVTKIMRELGDYPTLAGVVCLWKALYRRAALAD